MILNGEKLLTMSACVRPCTASTGGWRVVNSYVELFGRSRSRVVYVRGPFDYL